MVEKFEYWITVIISVYLSLQCLLLSLYPPVVFLWKGSIAVSLCSILGSVHARDNRIGPFL